MGTGDYVCVTLSGAAPWGFSLEEGEVDNQRSFLVSQVEPGGQAFLAGIQDGDVVVSVNGNPCADLTLLRASALIDTSTDSLQLCLKRNVFIPAEGLESEGRSLSNEVLESTTLKIFSPDHWFQSPKELYISESRPKADFGHLENDTDSPQTPQLYSVQRDRSSCENQGNNSENHEDGAEWSVSPGDILELQVSLSKQTLSDAGSAALGSAHGIEGELSKREVNKTLHKTMATSLCTPCPVREPLGQHGVVVAPTSMLGQVEVILQQPAASGAGRGILSVGGPEVSESLGSQSERQEGGGISEGVPASHTISFKTPSDEASGEEQGSDSEGDQERPNKHRARHARLRRNDSISEKQLKEAKSKCKRIALLLTAAPSNPNNKGVLMFKKHRQRAKKYTLVSYGTGEDEQEYSDEEDEENVKQEIPASEITFLATINSETDKPFISDATSSKCVLSFNLDKALLDIERNLQNQAEMECLPETKGKGALMFAQRRQRMDEISAEHEELRRQGMPVEGMQETNKRAAELSYMQSATEGHTYMDVNMHQQSQQQYQQYQEQQYYEQQQNYQQQHRYQQFQQQQYEQSQYQQQQIYHQQQQYHQEQQQMQQYPANINGTNHQQANEIQSSFNNQSAKPFAAENMVVTSYSHGVSVTSQDLAAQGEQIASRDERISTPAIKTSFLMDARRRNTGKPMFTFKEAPKMSPNPELLNLLNRSDKKLGFESGPEEDYLSLGAEACNFLQSQRVKPKIPPPVAPKPVINPTSPPWSPQIEAANQNMPQCAENSISTPAVAPTTDAAPPPELEPTTAPAVEHSPPLAPHETPASAITNKQHAWAPTEKESQQQPLQVTLPEENIEMKPSMQAESSQKTTWIAEQTQTQQQSSTGWHPAQAQPQEPLSGQTPTQLPWVTHKPTQSQAQPQGPTSTWTPQSQPNWSQPQGQSESQPQPPWIRPQEEPQSQQQHQVQASWAQTNEQTQSQQIQPAWLQTQGHPQQQAQNQWTHQSQVDSQQQALWVQQPQQKSQVQPPWAQQVQQEPQPQPPWVQQPQHQALQQSWAQAQASHQHQQTWLSGQPQQQHSVDAWGQSQIQVQVQPPWLQAAQPSPQPQPPPQPQPHPQPQPQPQANLNPWAPVPAQAQSQSQWVQHPLDNNQHHMNSWNQEQNQGQHQPPWVQTPPTQSTPYPGWQQQISSTPPQPQGETWAPAQTQLQTHVDSWTSQSQQTSTNVSVSKINNRPSPKPWQPLQNASQNLSTPPPPPRRMQSFTIGQRPSLPINPMATVLNPKSSPGSAFEMPVVKGKGADMFAKRQSRMEKFVVDSETVEANKASRSTSPAASLPNEWKYTPNVRAPPPRAYNPIQSPLYPPAASKQPPAVSPSTKAKKKDQEKQTPAPKPLNVIDVMKHQPYQLDSSLFIFGPGAEAVKPPIPKPSPPNPPTDNQPITYGQIAPVQQTGPYSSPYPQQAYGMPMQPPMHDGLYQQTQANVYPYQQPSAGLYPQQYNQQYQQPVQPAYHPQSPQPSNAPYIQPLQAAYQPANSPPYMAPPPVPYEQQSTSCYIAPSFPVVGRADSVSGGSNAAAPRPKFTANKSSAQAIGRSFSLSPPARLLTTGQKSASASSFSKPPTRDFTASPSWQTSRLEKGFKTPTPWEAASRHPLGLVDEAFQDLQQSLASNVHLAAQRKILPEPPAEWKARVSYQAPYKAGTQTWSQSCSKSPNLLPSFVSPTRRPVYTPASHAGYRSLPRQWQPHKYEEHLRPTTSPSDYTKPVEKPAYKSVSNSSTWRWRQ